MRLALVIVLLARVASAQTNVAAPPSINRILGTLTERGTRAPLAHATILAYAGERQVAEAESDARGSFGLQLPRGAMELQLVVTSSGHKVLKQREVLKADDVLTVRYVLSRSSYAQYESTVRAAPAREEIARVSLTREEVLRIPGTRGDALQAVLNLPSVARSPFDFGQLILRGSAPGDSSAFVNGIAIPQTFHFAGLTSTFNAFLLERFDLVPSNFSVRFGRLTGGIVDIVPREGRTDRYHGELKLDVYDAHLIVEGPLGKKDANGERPGSFALAARRSYIDAILGTVAPDLGLTLAPRYYDYQAMLDYKLGPGKLKVLFFGSDDAVALVQKSSPDSDSSLQGRFSTRLWFHQMQARYQLRKGIVEVEALVAPSVQHQDGTLGSAATFDLDVVEVDARLEARVRLRPWLKLTGGLDLQTDWYKTSTLAPHVATEAQPQGPLTGTKTLLQASAFEGNPALYLQGDLKLGKLLLVPGFRIDWLSAVHGTFPQPRIMSRYEIVPHTFLKAGIGLFAQAANAPYDNAVLGNPRLTAQQAIHATVGVETRPFSRIPGLELQVNVFAKYLWGIAVASSELTQRDGRVVPEVYSDLGIGRVYGADLLLKHTSSRWVYGWIAYTISKSERRDGTNLPWRNFEYDQTHVLTIVAGYHLPWEIDLGLRFRYATGNPEIRQGPGAYDADHDVTLPSVVGQPYQYRLPDFVALDVRVDKRFAFKRWIFAIYVDVQNVTNRKNVEGYSYSFDYTQRAPLTGLPIIPSLGLRATF